MLIRALMLACLPALLLLGCPKQDDDDATGDDDAGDDDAGDDDGGDDDAGDDDSVEQARWSFLVFMNGDNDLESLVFKDLNELEEVGSGNDVHVLVQADRAEGYYSGDGDWTGCRRYYITGDSDPQSVSSQILEEMGECDMGVPETLSDFLLWAHNHYPSERVVLVLWNHGDGWTVRGEESGGPPHAGFISHDEESDHWLSIAEGDLRDGLAPYVAARGPIDVLAFDACNMGSWEVAHSVRDQALTMCASETTVGDEGFLYAPAIATMRDVDADADEVAIAMQMAEQAVTIGGEWTNAAIDLAALDDLAGAVDTLAAAALDDPALVPLLLAARDDTGGCDPTWHDWYLDLDDLGQVLAGAVNPTLAAAGEGIVDEMDGAVLGAWGNPPYAWTGGLTIYFDPMVGYLQPYCYGAGATWAQETHWDELMLYVGPN